MPFDVLVSALQTRFPGVTTSSFRDNRRVHVQPGDVYAVLEFLKAEGFDQLAELTAVDYLKYPGATDRFGVIYGLLNTQTSERVWVKVGLNEPDLTLPSAFPLWRGADWLEREVYDMYGIEFDGHPDLRRILMPEAATNFPLRKDYPLRGRGERHNFPAIIRSQG